MKNTPPVAWVKYRAAESFIHLGQTKAVVELAHRRLADYVWSSGLWPHPTARATAELAKVRVALWPRVLDGLKDLGWILRRGRLVHPQVEGVLREAIRYRAEAIQHGRRGGRPSREEELRQSRKPTLNPPLTHPKGTPNPLDIKGTSTDIALNNDERLTLIASTPRKSSGKAEKEFLEDVLGALSLASPKTAKAELATWGGWWRNRYRENPTKARKILAEIASMIREHRIIDSPGAAAGDLWKRLP